jgi:hypothetical protein
MARDLGSGRQWTIARTKIGKLSNPSLRGTHVIWVDARSGATYLRAGRLGSTKRSVLARIRSRKASYWTTSLTVRAAFMTRWTISSGAARIYTSPA